MFPILIFKTTNSVKFWNIKVVQHVLSGFKYIGNKKLKINFDKKDNFD